ncbi:MAG: DUF559 domain-containing protein [Micromonosporaceae bacterium]
MDEGLEEIGFRQGGAFRAGQAFDAGLTRSRLARRRRLGDYAALRRSVYVDTRLADLTASSKADRHALAISAAILRVAGQPAASHESAALLWGIDILGERRGERGETVQLTRARRGQGGATAYPNLAIHHAALPLEHLARQHGVAVTSAARTVVDIARTRPFRAGVVAADSALRQKLCTPDELLQVATSCTRWPGIRRARDVVAFADPRSESPLESISRVAFHEHGVPAPSLQEWVTPYDRVDFLWPRQRVIGEADGMAKYTDPEALRHEKERQELLERLGYRFVRWGWREAFHRPDALAHWILGALHPGSVDHLGG